MAAMVSIIQSEEGYVGLAPVMERLGMSTEEALKVFQRHDQVRRMMRESYHERKNIAFKERKRRAVDELPQGPSYGPGICDSGSGPSADISDVPGISARRSSCDVSVGEFVAIPFGPAWYVAEVTDVHRQQVQLRYLY